MALVAVRAVVHIPVHVRVLEIAGVVIAMAPGALKDRKVGHRDVAGRTVPTCVAMGDGELRVSRVRETRPRPVDQGAQMAVQARGREESGVGRRGVRGVRSPVVVGLMAADACDGQRCVVGVDVAIAAQPGRHGV